MGKIVRVGNNIINMKFMLTICATYFTFIIMDTQKHKEIKSLLANVMKNSVWSETHLN